MSSQPNTPIQTLRHWLMLHQPKALMVAYSGGVDSHALLHMVHALGLQGSMSVRAIHINHSLSDQSSGWQQHCESVCQKLNISLQVMQVDAHKLQKELGIEGAAREARYQAFTQTLYPDEYLLAAHHSDDQAETVLLNLFRGSGHAGLAAMPVCRPLGQGFIARPMLSHGKDELLTYAQEHGLQFIHDLSNDDLSLNRNFIRHQIMPTLKQRWPSLRKTLCQQSQFQRESEITLELMAESLLTSIKGDNAQTLSVTELKQHSEAIQIVLFRLWLKQLGFRPPNRKKLHQGLRDLLYAGSDRQPILEWSDCEVRRHRDLLYAMSPLTDFDQNQCLPWDLSEPLEYLPNYFLHASDLADLADALIGRTDITVRFRQGGECFTPHHSQAKNLKKLLNKSGIEPWKRPRLPLVFLGDQLIACVGVYHLHPTQL